MFLITYWSLKLLHFSCVQRDWWFHHKMSGEKSPRSSGSEDWYYHVSDMWWMWQSLNWIEWCWMQIVEQFAFACISLRAFPDMHFPAVSAQNYSHLSATAQNRTSQDYQRRPMVCWNLWLTLHWVRILYQRGKQTTYLRISSHVLRNGHQQWSPLILW